MNPTILIVDDEKHTREGLRASLEDSFEVYVAGDIQGAINTLDGDQIDLVLTDLRLGGEDGMQLVDKVLARPHPPIVIMMTAYGSVDAAVEAMKRGAYDFVTKPLNIDRLEVLIARRPDVQPEADRVAHRAAGEVDRRLVAEQLGDPLAQRDDRGVVVLLLVADLGLGHRLAHRRRRAGLGVGVEVDHDAGP